MQRRTRIQQASMWSWHKKALIKKAFEALHNKLPVNGTGVTTFVCVERLIIHTLDGTKNTDCNALLYGKVQ
jgi:hypothetical protein